MLIVSTVASQPTPVVSSSSGLSNIAGGASTQPAVGSTTLPASSVEATTTLPSGGTGFALENVGKFGLCTKVFI